MKKDKYENKQLLRYQKQLSKPATKPYLFILVVMIALVHLLDTYASDVCIKVQSLYVNDFFVIGKGMSFESGLQSATIITTIGYVFAVIGPFYKALMDKIGRRPIFVINTFGMALGMFICYLSPNFIIFAIGQLLILFFTMHDMQMIYVYECAPSKWRSTLYFACKFIGVFGTLAIPLLRDKYVQPDGSGWRNVFFIPTIVGLVIFAMALFFMKESPVFAKSRIEYLNIPVEERNKEKTDKKEKQSGIFPALKYIFRDKQLKWLTIAIIVTCTSMFALTSYYESFLSTAISTNDVTVSLYYQPFAMSVMYLISGFLADLIGRKKASVVFAVICFASFTLFIILANKGASAELLGILLGAYLGSFWNVTDLNGMMFAESTPTEIRGSVMGVQSIMFGVGTAISLVACTILLSFFSVGTVIMIVGAPGLVVGTIITMLKIKETKGTDLSTIKYTMGEK